MSVVADITMSLDGFVTGPDAGPDAGLGVGTEALHTWVMEGDEVDRAALDESFERTGAVIMGRNLFDVIDGPAGWSDEMGYGAEHVGTPPYFVVTHEAPSDVRLDLDFTFVTDGIESAIHQARTSAGAKDVVVMGGGDVVRQAVESGLVDELVIHLSPMIIGDGTPLFGPGPVRHMTIERVRPSSTATHITYRLHPEEMP